MSHTHTYAVMPVTQSTFDEVKANLKSGGYDGHIHDDSRHGELLDMSGIGLSIGCKGPDGIDPDSNRFGYFFLDLVKNLSAWSQKTFGADSVRGPIGPLKHLAKEVQETLANPNDIKEYADLLILVLDASRRAGINVGQLLAAARLKHIENSKRDWPPPSKDDEPIEHIRTVPETVEVTYVGAPTDVTYGGVKVLEGSVPIMSPKELPMTPIQVMESLQVWLHNNYPGDNPPMALLGHNVFYQYLTIDDWTIWDSEDGYVINVPGAREMNQRTGLDYETCKRVYAALVLKYACPFLEGMVDQAVKENVVTEQEAQAMKKDAEIIKDAFLRD